MCCRKTNVYIWNLFLEKDVRREGGDILLKKQVLNINIGLKTTQIVTLWHIFVLCIDLRDRLGHAFCLTQYKIFSLDTEYNLLLFIHEIFKVLNQNCDMILVHNCEGFGSKLWRFCEWKLINYLFCQEIEYLIPLVWLWLNRPKNFNILVARENVNEYLFY